MAQKLGLFYMEFGIEHIIGVIDGRRKDLGISKKALVAGICTPDIFSKILGGQGRRLDKVEIDALMQRVGFNAKSCNCLLDADEYGAFTEREHIREILEKCSRDTDLRKEAAGRIAEYKKKCRCRVELQIACYFETQLMYLSGEDEGNQLEKCMDTLRITIADFDIQDMDSYLYSEVEMFLATRILYILGRTGQKKLACQGYEKLLSLMGTERYRTNESMRFFAKIIYDASVLYMEEGNYTTVSSICEYAIEQMPKENKFRYLPEIYEMKARADALQAAAGHGNDESLFKALYENSKEYKYYENLKYIGEKYPEEYFGEMKYQVYREYNVVFVGDIIRQRRKLLKMTQSDLAYYVNNDEDGKVAEEDEICSEKTLSRLENGRTVTSWRVTRRLLSKLRLPPERYFFDYVADDYGLLRELSNIDKKFMAGEYEEIVERCEALGRANSFGHYPYNQQRLDNLIYSVKRINHIVDGEEAEKMIINALKKTIPADYLKDNCCIYLFANENRIIGNIIQNMRRSEGTEVCLTLMEKMIKGYRDTAINEDVCAMNILWLNRKYESFTANSGNFDTACVLADRGMREVIKHNFLGGISSYLYELAWNKAKKSEKDKELKKLLKCVYTATQIRSNIVLRQFADKLYQDLFGDNIEAGM